MTKLRIGILGTRGIPNRYGGFEECAEKLALGLVAKGHDVSVYSSSLHEYQQPEWKGVQIIHCKDPEPKLGTAGQFIYDWHCFSDARRRKYEVLLQLGYTSSSIWYWRWPRSCWNLVNMDGLEWKRSKYSPKVRAFLKMAERLAARHADGLVADSPGIQQHLLERYGKASSYIPYGAYIFEHPDAAVPASYGVEPYRYHLLMARMEPENNIETILKAYLLSGESLPLLIIGGTGNGFGQYLESTYSVHPQLRFLGGIYEASIIHNLRYFSRLYYHGHSVGGTNPSLLEAMGCGALIAAHDNIFNRSVLGADAFYFSNQEDLAGIILQVQDKESWSSFLEHNRQKIRDRYNWPAVVDAYERLMIAAVVKNKK